MAVVCWLYVVIAVLGRGREIEAFWWPFSGSEEREEVSSVTAHEPVAFEMASAEQKFLAEAQQFLNLSPLEACQHEVVSKLRESCGSMGEEDLGKMAVALLNCQSRAENRPTFPCTPDMTLAECTADMDPAVWNAYHIVSNRARSVCYATRQQQFRKQTEYVVNQLSSSTLQQMQAMTELSDQQAEVKQLAQSSLQTLQEAQVEAEIREREMAAHQAGVKEKIAANLEHLAQEKVLITSGQQLLANMTSDIAKQLRIASGMLGSQEEHMKRSQKEILDDITTVRHNIQTVWGRIDNRTTQLLDVLEDITDHYQTTLDSLRVINETLAGMQGVVEGMSSAVNSQLDWVVGQLGGANRGLRVLTSCAGHALFLLVAMLVVVFVKVPAMARVFLLVAVVANAIIDVKMGVALTFTALGAVATIVIVLNWIYVSFRSSTSSHAPAYFLPSAQPHIHPMSHPPPSHHSSHPHNISHSDGTLEASHDDSLEYEIDTKPHSCRASRDLTPQFRAAETLSSTPTKVSSSHGPGRCVAMTYSGMQCRLRPLPGEVTCHKHS